MTWKDWADEVIKRIGGVPTSHSEAGFYAQMAGENTAASWNPNATTEHEPGSWSFNPAGVQDFPSAEEGIAATAATLTNGLYPALVLAIKDGTDANRIAQEWAASPWGTGRLVVEKLPDVMANLDAYAARQVSGTVAPVATVPAQTAPEVTPCAELPVSPPPVGKRMLSLTTPPMTGTDVADCQNLLDHAGFSPADSKEDSGRWDGVFGPATEGAVKALQEHAGLVADGIVGKRTWCVLGLR